MEMSADQKVAALAGRQYGVVSRRQLRAAGLTEDAVTVRVRRGRLVPVHRGVYLLGDLRGTLEPARAREMAAVVACGASTFVSHRSAGRLWGLLPGMEGGRRGDVDVVIPRGMRRTRPGIRAHRSDQISAGETVVLDGIPVTTPARTLRDLSAVLSPRELNRAIARAERLNLISAADVASLVARHRGRRGAPHLRAAVRVNGGPTLTRSVAEERFLDLVASGGLPRPTVNVFVGSHEVDFLWRDPGLAVEVDGYAFHGSRPSFESDRLRDSELAAAGIHVLRVTWRQITRKRTETLVLIARALARREFERVSGVSGVSGVS